MLRPYNAENIVGANGHSPLYGRFANRPYGMLRPYG